MAVEQAFYIIGIGGGSASGKTFFLRSLRERFSEEELCIISQDDYYRPAEEQKADEMGVLNFDLPESIDVERFLSHIELLAKGQVVTKKEYTFNNPSAQAKELILRPAPVIVVEGLFIFHIREIHRMLNLTIYMDSRDDLKLYRRLHRDVKERGLTEEMVLHQWHHHVYPAYKQYLLPYKDEADIIIANNTSFSKGLEVVANHIKGVIAGYGV